jgi:glyoxylase-like metal-dependent hydrolase (beta-lactamase superfamily II)
MMTRPVKRILWVFGIVLGLMILAATVFLANFIIATRAMTPAETAAINDSAWCIKDRFVNAFIFKGKKNYLMIDAGIDTRLFRKELDKLGINPDNITTLLLTHTDADHTGSIPLFKNLSVFLHRDEEKMINGTNGKTKYSKTLWKYGPYKLLNDNDSLCIDGLSIKVIHTPGHTPGSVCYIIGTDYLVSGDNLIMVNGKYDHFVEKFNMNTAQEIESLKLLPDPATFRYILTGHFGAVKMKP